MQTESAKFIMLAKQNELLHDLQSRGFELWCMSIPFAKLMIYTHPLNITTISVGIIQYFLRLTLFNVKSMYTIMYVHDERQPDMFKYSCVT